MAAACVLMTTNVTRPKGSGTPFALESDSLDSLVGDATASLIEISGAIKWFDVSKGFGFIVPDNGMADVLLHVTCLRRDGYQTAHEGARIVVEAVQRPKGLQAFRILSMDESTAIHPAQMPTPR
jgi:cold shock protein